jgi:cytochrome c6
MFPFADWKALMQNSRALNGRFSESGLRSQAGWLLASCHPYGGLMLVKEDCTPSAVSYKGPITGAWFLRAARIGAFAIILGTAIGLLGFAPRAGAAPPGDAAAGEQTYKANCVSCHGADGTGTATGKILKAPDLHSDAVQKMTAAQLVAQVSDGKNNMPPFKSTLSKDQIDGVVAYVRATFGKKK